MKDPFNSHVAKMTFGGISVYIVLFVGAVLYIGVDKFHGPITVLLAFMNYAIFMFIWCVACWLAERRERKDKIVWHSLWDKSV